MLNGGTNITSFTITPALEVLMQDHIHLAHHGIKGMKWGVRRYQNPDGTLTPAGHQRYLNKLDSEARSAVSGAYNARQNIAYYSAQSKKAEAKGNVRKAEKYSRRAKDLETVYQQEGRKYMAALQDVESSGYSWKSTPMNHMGVHITRTGRDFIKKHGTLSLRAYSNSASGNIYKVRKNTSEKRDRKWKETRSIQTHRPQRVDYVYV